ncbi:MAG: SusC/RagA family TonB-linked outer membrane protein, partial [Bacteroidales bacterium]|nr:SusC/RagA family TonB-linked outer membrane protein [Bacteroidales bacterium]
SSQWQNIGQLRNKGIELSVSTINVHKRDFSWRTDFNVSFIRNKLVSLQSGKEYMYARTGFSSNFSQYDYIAQVGKPLGSMYGYVFDGVYQQSDFEVYADGSRHLKAGVPDISEHAGVTAEPGFVKYKDVDGDGVITPEDRTAIGNGQPDAFGGMNNSFWYRGFDFSFLFQFSYGNDVYNAQRMFATQSDLEMMNMLGEIRNRWTVTNASNTVPSAKGYVRNDVYSRFIEDGSYLRLKNVTFGYTLPQNLTRKVNIRKFRLYFTAENLLLLTKYSGYDPEVSMSSNPMMPGYDYGAYPRSRVYTFGAEINF